MILLLLQVSLYMRESNSTMAVDVSTDRCWYSSILGDILQDLSQNHKDHEVS